MKVRADKGTLNLRGISRQEMGAKGADNEFANELAGFLANPTGGAKAQAGRVGSRNERTTVNLRGEYNR